MKTPIFTPPQTAVSRLKERLLHPWSHHPRDEASQDVKASLPAFRPARPVGFPASVAEFLLVFRLRARRRSSLSADMLERAVRMVLVTCKHWFTPSDLPPSRSRKPD